METKNNFNIILIGMPGAGKTFIGNKLAKLLVQFEYIDTDQKIEEETGLTISEIFEKYGEKYFRKLETNLLQNLSKNKNQIISIGGGAIENEENLKLINNCGLTFYMQTTIDEIFNRIKDETHRPLIHNKNPKQTLRNLLKKREQNYLKAKFIIDTTQKPAYTILDEIIGKYENYAKQMSLC